MNREEVTYCRYCHQKLVKKLGVSIKICRYCGSDQRPWVNIIKFASTATALLMVIISVGQVLISRSQVEISQKEVDEAKRKRVEAEEVLSKARNVFSVVSSNSNEVKRKNAQALAVAGNAVERSGKVLQFAEDNAIIAKSFSDNSMQELANTKRSFHGLAVTLTTPIATSLAIGSNPFVYQPLTSKINQVEEIKVSLRNMGIEEDLIDKAVEPFTLRIKSDHIRSILDELNKLLPADKRLSSEYPTYEEAEKWNLKLIEEVMKKNNVKLSGELEEAIRDLQFYLKNHRLRRPGKWQG